MAEIGDRQLRVTTEELLNASSEVRRMVSRMRNVFTEIGNVVRRSAGYWEGHGQESHVRSYNSKQDRIDMALRRFEENATDLEIMAGVYEQAERVNADLPSQLPTDVIS